MNFSISSISKLAGALIAVSLCLVACTQTGRKSETAARKSPPAVAMKDVRLAEAEFAPEGATPAQGAMLFEQMPNSMIVTFRVEGLKPRSQYQIFAHPEQDCEALNPAKAERLTILRTDRKGIAEGSFRSERSLVGRRPVLGSALVIRPGTAKVDGHIACGKIEARSSISSTN